MLNTTDSYRKIENMKFGQKRLTVTKEKMLEKVHYRVLIGLMLFGVVYYLYWEPTTIGHDSRYTFYIFLLPTLLGLLTLAVYRRKLLINKFSMNKSFKLWTLMTIFYLIQGLLISYLSFGQIAKISWDILNTRTAKKNIEEVFDCKITRFWTGKSSNNIDFIFKDRNNNFNVHYNNIKEYLETNPDDYYLKITARKGLWNYYLVESWEIKAKK